MQTIISEKRFTEKQTAEMLKISEMTLKRHRKNGTISFYKVGARILFGERHILKFLRSCEQNNELKANGVAEIGGVN